MGSTGAADAARRTAEGMLAMANGTAASSGTQSTECDRVAMKHLRRWHHGVPCRWSQRDCIAQAAWVVKLYYTLALLFDNKMNGVHERDDSAFIQ